MYWAQAADARAGEALVGAALDYRHVDLRQRVLAREHEPGRAGAGERGVGGVSPSKNRRDGTKGACREEISTDSLARTV